MTVRSQVVQAWQRLTYRVRQIIRKKALRSGNAVSRLRSKILLALVPGKSPAQLAFGGLCVASQASRVAHRFLVEGLRAIADRREDNGPHEVDARYESELLSVVAGSPQGHGFLRPTWTQELLALVLAGRTGIAISVPTMSRLPKRHRVRLGRPKPTVECPRERARRQRRLRRLRRLVRDAGPDEVVVYVDEVDIHPNPKIGPDWRLSGRQKTVPTPGKNQERYPAGALDARTGELTWVEGRRKTSLLFLRLLHRLVTRTYRRARRIHLILDNYGIHDSLRVRPARATAKDRVKSHSLPPYCPDHNRIERVWKDLHADATRNHRCKDMEELMAQVRVYLGNRNKRKGHAYPRAMAV